MLKEILNKKKERIALAKQSLSEDELKKRINDLPPPISFLQAIKKARQIALIAEIKKSSPSRGVIREDFSLQEISRIYKESDVQAISVLTEEDYFSGNLSYINEVKNISGLPVLRKDFILEPYQIYESRYYGADAILLIAGILSKDSLSSLISMAEELKMDYLVEVHNEKELKKVINLKVPLIGINNRDLSTLEVDFKTTEKIFPLIPKGKTVVVESGIKNYQDILFLKILGVNAVLVGEVLMEAPDIAKKIEELMGG